MKQYGILILLTFILGVLIFLTNLKEGMPVDEAVIFPIVLLVACLLFSLVETIIDFFHRWPIPTAEPGNYHEVSNSLAEAFPFTILEKDGKYFKACLTKDNLGKKWNGAGNSIGIYR